MKHKRNDLLHTMVSLGAVLLALRLRLYIVAVDEKNLLVSGHMLSWLIWAVTAAALILAVTAALRTKETDTLPVSSPVAALGDGLFAIAIAITVFAMGTPASVLEKVRMAAGYLCVPCLGYAAFCRAKGKPVFFGCFAVVCVFFALYLVSCYRLWSSNPQLQDYVFAMLTCAAVTIFAYQSAALAAGIGSKCLWLAAGMLTVAFGIAAVCQAENGLLYMAAAGWALTGLLKYDAGTEPGEN